MREQLGGHLVSSQGKSTTKGKAFNTGKVKFEVLLKSLESCWELQGIDSNGCLHREMQFESSGSDTNRLPCCSSFVGVFLACSGRFFFTYFGLLKISVCDKY